MLIQSNNIVALIEEKKTYCVVSVFIFTPHRHRVHKIGSLFFIADEYRCRGSLVFIFFQMFPPVKYKRPAMQHVGTRGTWMLLIGPTTKAAFTAHGLGAQTLSISTGLKFKGIDFWRSVCIATGGLFCVYTRLCRELSYLAHSWTSCFGSSCCSALCSFRLPFALQSHLQWPSQGWTRLLLNLVYSGSSPRMQSASRTSSWENLLVPVLKHPFQAPSPKRWLQNWTPFSLPTQSSSSPITTKA